MSGWSWQLPKTVSIAHSFPFDYPGRRTGGGQRCPVNRCPVSGVRGALAVEQAYSAIRSIFSLPVSVAEREGFFRREGLNFRVVVPIPGGSDKMIDALHDDTCDVTHVATPFLIRAALAGSDAVAIAAEFNNPIYSLVARPEIKNFADLKGKLLGLADEAGTITISTRKLLALHGLRGRFPRQNNRGDADAVYLLTTRRMCCGPAWPAPRFARVERRLSTAGTLN